MRFVIALVGLLFLQSVPATEFDQPWNDPKVALVIDPYYANSINWDDLAKEPRLVAVIHKATVGTNKMDPAYLARKAEAKKRGYLWGSYHWGVAGAPEKQADYYIDMVKPEEDELVALDLEDVTSNKLMNADEALRFMRRVKERIHRYPVLYMNHSSVQLFTIRYKKNSEFAAAPLWYARFKRAVTDFPVGLWPTYTLWQYSSEILPQKPIPGTKSDMDVSVFNGTVEQLKAMWPLTNNAP
jgi:lysozyme